MTPFVLTRALGAAATRGDECASPHVGADVTQCLRRQGHEVTLTKAHATHVDADMCVDRKPVHLCTFHDGWNGVTVGNALVRVNAMRTVHVSPTLVQRVTERVSRGWLQHWPSSAFEDGPEEAPSVPVTFVSERAIANAVIFLLNSTGEQQS